MPKEYFTREAAKPLKFLAAIAIFYDMCYNKSRDTVFLHMGVRI